MDRSQPTEHERLENPVLRVSTGETSAPAVDEAAHDGSEEPPNIPGALPQQVSQTHAQASVEQHPPTQPTSAVSSGGHQPHDTKGTWKAIALDSRTFAAFIIITIALIAGIVAVTVISSIKHGFHLSDPTEKVLSFTWRHGLLWTALPTLVFQLFRICFDVVVSALSNRQPFVELERGAAPEKTILLD